MNYISVEGISKSYGEKVLFSDISFGINEGQKVALIAANGTGKTTLLNIIAGTDTADIGQVVTRNGLNIQYVSQQHDFNEELTIKQSIFDSDNIVLKVIDAYEKALQNPDSEQYQRAFELMDKHNAWDFETQYKQLLFKLQLTDFDQQIKNLSGGQKKRLSLCLKLLNKPDVLLLDEPTNHLDVEMIEWLENYLKNEKITLLLITHDRYFLNKVCIEILELENNQLYKYKGDYQYYLAKKEERIIAEQANIDKAKNLYTKELDWMRRQPKARTTKSKSRIDDFYEIKQKALQKREEHKVQLEINIDRLGNKIVELHNISKSFGDKLLLKNFSYNFLKEERIGIVGKNGSGKSTLLNIITQNLASDTGKLVIGETIKMGYYTQSGINIKEGQKVIDVITEIAEYIPLKKGQKISASQLLERFLFDRKKQYDFVEKLSGGEQKRLYLCAILIKNPNFLILDEPTNDLDIVTINVLENFLLDYPGNLLVVSHDRHFMDKIVDSLFVLNDDGTITHFPGNYSDYRAYEDSNPAEKNQETRTKKQEDYKTVKVGFTSQEKREFGSLEADIERLQNRKIVIEKAFAATEMTADEIEAKSIELQEIMQTLEAKEERWLELSLKLED